MVKTVDYITSHSNSKKFNLKQHLTCKSYGIYVAECKFCKMQYVGQTKNKFSTRWNNHRSFWNKFNVKDNNDRAVLTANTVLLFWFIILNGFCLNKVLFGIIRLCIAIIG